MTGSAPIRIQRRRVKGWRMPDAATQTEKRFLRWLGKLQEKHRANYENYLSAWEAEQKRLIRANIRNARKNKEPTDDCPTPTPLPSRERAAELARDVSADAEGAMMAAVHDQSKRLYDIAAILSAYAAGRLVPVERVSEMREACAKYLDDMVKVFRRFAASHRSDYEERRKHKALADQFESAATAIRALPLESPHD